MDRPRTQFLIELPWDAQQAMQQLGRTHRSDQHNSPTYELITSNLNAEKRFASTVSKRAADLGAATTGDRRGANEESAFGSDILIGTDAIHGLHKCFEALRNPYDWPVWCDPIVDYTAGATEVEKDDQRRASWRVHAPEMAKAFRLLGITIQSQPKQLLGRLLGMETGISNECMHLFESACTEAHIQSVKHSNDQGVEDIVIEPGSKTSVIHTTQGGAISISTDIGVSFEDAVAKAKKWVNEGPVLVDPTDGTEKATNRWCFCTRADTVKGRIYNVLAQLEPPRVRITRPNGREAMHFLSEFKQSYQKVVDQSQAKVLWDKEFTLSLTTCSHGPGCKDAHCVWGKRCVTSTIVKMPGALNTLSDYVGQRQILRFCDKSNQEKCVAVRLGTTHVSVEDKLVAERARQEAFALKASQQKAADTKTLICNSTGPSASASTSTDSPAAASVDFINDSDEESKGSQSSDEHGDSDDSDGSASVSNANGKRPMSKREAARAAEALFRAASSEEEEDDADDYGPDAVAHKREARKPLTKKQKVQLDVLMGSDSEEED